MESTGCVPAAQGRVELELPPEPESVQSARDAVTGFAEGRGGDLEGIALAVSEAVTNAVLHAFRGREQGTIEVRAGLSGEELVVSVGDDGVGMRPNTESPGLGLGLSLIGSVADGLEIEKRDPGTLLRIRFRVGEPAAA
jgi:anti-sigma regulatory factor (Ser/Thr protein kinase)